jgi:CheY-like chemotaxis protein
MLRRIDELRALLGRLEVGDGAACDAARKIAQALRGSGATFGFPDLSAVSAIVETSADADVLRRVEGLITELHILTAPDGTPPPFRAEWFARAMDGLDAVADREGVRDVSAAWDNVGRSSGLDPSALSDRVARYLGLGVADLTNRSRSALRLVPEAFMMARRVIPLSEDSVTITVALSEPTSLPMELELERLTSRQPVFTVAPPTAIDAVLSTILDVPVPSTTAPEDGLIRSTRGESDVRDKEVLIVDDDPSARLLVSTLLSKRGYRVLEAEDGVEALEVMERKAGMIGLLVADLNMPRMDGLELMWEVRDMPAWGHIPVIIVTGEIDEILETQLMEEGADDYIRKPLDPRLFLARVEATIRRAED